MVAVDVCPYIVEAVIACIDREEIVCPVDGIRIAGGVVIQVAVVDVAAPRVRWDDSYSRIQRRWMRMLGDVPNLLEKLKTA